MHRIAILLFLAAAPALAADPAPVPYPEGYREQKGKGFVFSGYRK